MFEFSHQTLDKKKTKKKVIGSFIGVNLKLQQ